jgi:uncharacterized protein (DUF433 family)
MKLDRITINPKVCLGMPCIRGMRITVAMVLNLVANGMSNEKIISEHPDLEVEDIRQCLRYAALLAGDRSAPREEHHSAVSR